jgi:hypothetical protein
LIYLIKRPSKNLFDQLWKRSFRSIKQFSFRTRFLKSYWIKSKAKITALYMKNRTAQIRILLLYYLLASERKIKTLIISIYTSYLKIETKRSTFSGLKYSGTTSHWETDKWIIAVINGFLRQKMFSKHKQKICLYMLLWHFALQSFAIISYFAIWFEWKCLGT